MERILSVWTFEKVNSSFTLCSSLLDNRSFNRQTLIDLLAAVNMNLLSGSKAMHIIACSCMPSNFSGGDSKFSQDHILTVLSLEEVMRYLCLLSNKADRISASW